MQYLDTISYGDSNGRASGEVRPVLSSLSRACRSSPFKAHPSSKAPSIQQLGSSAVPSAPPTLIIEKLDANFSRESTQDCAFLTV